MNAENELYQHVRCTQTDKLRVILKTLNNLISLHMDLLLLRCCLCSMCVFPFFHYIRPNVCWFVIAATVILCWVFDGISNKGHISMQCWFVRNIEMLLSSVLIILLVLHFKFDRHLILSLNRHDNENNVHCTNTGIQSFQDNIAELILLESCPHTFSLHFSFPKIQWKVRNTQNCWWTWSAQINTQHSLHSIVSRLHRG